MTAELDVWLRQRAVVDRIIRSGHLLAEGNHGDADRPVSTMGTRMRPPGPPSVGVVRAEFGVVSLLRRRDRPGSLLVTPRCKGPEFDRRRHWTRECLDIIVPDGTHTHVHGTWTGWTDGDLQITLSAPYREYRPGQNIAISPIVQLWRPSAKAYVYRPRDHFASLPSELQEWLTNNPAWDTDLAVVVGPVRHQ